MAYKSYKQKFQNILNEIEENGLYKRERVITTKQGAMVDTTEVKGVLNFCANNYLGLSANEEIMQAAIEGTKKYGFGLSSVRFICGTQTVHKELEAKVSKFLGMDDTILYTSCFDANGGLFETITTNEDAIISDELNHASIIDGVRLSKAMRYRYKNNDMADLEAKLIEATNSGAKLKLIVTDGVFSMDGIIANLKGVCDLADKYDALVVVDDSHATGFIGKTGRGTHEYCEVMDRVDIITSTFGKAMGGASGGFTSGRQEIIDLLRQRSRPYLFSNTLAPSIANATLKVIDIIEKSPERIEKLRENSTYFRSEMEKKGFTLLGKDHAIIPVYLGDAKLAQEVAKKMLEKGIYVIGFFFPVVPKEKARIRTQMSAAHSKADIDKLVKAFVEVRKEIGF
ncbi:MAG: glycine C-acetyltransferase [Firmicutes bacterium]|nr:glycine C-acetyltransferase [Bacillota bacterium]